MNNKAKKNTPSSVHETTGIQAPRISFIDGLLKLFREGYSTPHIYKAMLDTFILLVLVGSSIVSLMSLKVIDEHIGVVLLALLMGFIFGKIK
jgi:hypothetical protein